MIKKAGLTPKEILSQRAGLSHQKERLDSHYRELIDRLQAGLQSSLDDYGLSLSNTGTMNAILADAQEYVEHIGGKLFNGLSPSLAETMLFKHREIEADFKRVKAPARKEKQNYWKSKAKEEKQKRIELEEKLKRFEEINHSMEEVERKLSKRAPKGYQFYDFIWVVDQYMAASIGGKPTGKSVWNEIENNHYEHDHEGIITKVEKNTIYWCSKWNHSGTLSGGSLSSALSKIRKKRNKAHKYY